MPAAHAILDREAGLEHLHDVPSATFAARHFHDRLVQVRI